MASEYRDWASDGLALVPDDDLLDLDALEHAQRVAVAFAGTRYLLARSDDLSLLDNENLRRLFVRLWELEHRGGDEDGLIAPADMAVAERIDRHICAIALYGRDGDLGPLAVEERAAVVAAMSPRQRNAVRNAFFAGYGGMAYARTIAQLALREMLAAARASETPAAAPTVAEPEAEMERASTTSDSAPPSTPKSTRSRASRAASRAATTAA